MNIHPTRWRPRIIAVLLTVCLATLGLFATTSQAVAKDNAKTTSVKKKAKKSSRAKLQALNSCSDMRGYLTDAIVNNVVDNNYGYYGGFGGLGGLETTSARSADGVATTAGASAGGGDAPGSYSTTNTQEQGVDEMDFVKTDGKYIYLLQGRRFSIVKSWPLTEAKEVASLTLDGYGQSLFLHGDRVVLASQNWSAVPAAFKSGSATRLTFLDISDREAPEVIRTVDLEGWLTTGRLIGSEGYFVLSSMAAVPQEVWNEAWNLMSDPGFPQITEWHDQDHIDKQKAKMRKELRPAIKKILAKHEVSDFLPRYVETVGKKTGDPEILVSCADLYKPNKGSQLGTLSVVNMDIADDDGAPSAAGVLASGWQVYASQDNLYVSMSNWGWGWGWSQDPSLEIHKFSLRGDAGEPRYEASGSVDGWQLNQFSMSEHDGFLRVATTTNGTWNPQTGEQQQQVANHIFVLEDDDGRLQEVGAIRDIAPGEQIQSARFMGERGYLVTFERIDPLFTIDLSNPRRPEIKGELKIPGFSSYMHPLGEDHLLAVGMDGTETGQITGMQVSIFDVSDFENPELVHKHKLGNDSWGWSEAMWNHHAFTFHDGVLAVPASWWADQENAFNGLIAMTIDPKEGIHEIGRVDHSALGYQACIAQNTAYNNSSGWDAQAYCANGQNNMWYASMRRSIIIDQGIVSISTAGLRVNMLADLDKDIATIAVPTVW